MRSRPRHGRGFTLVEVLFGLLILGLVMTTSLAVFYDHERRVRHAEEMVLVWQAISNEAELLRLRPWHTLSAGQEASFQSDLEILESLEGVVTRIEVTEIEEHVKSVSLQVEWGSERRASSTVIRTDTGGSNLW